MCFSDPHLDWVTSLLPLLLTNLYLFPLPQHWESGRITPKGRTQGPGTVRQAFSGTRTSHLELRDLASGKTVPTLYCGAGIWCSHIPYRNALVWICQLLSDSASCQCPPWEGTGDGSYTWVPATKTEFRATGFSPAQHWGANQRMENFCLSAFHKKQK